MYLEIRRKVKNIFMATCFPWQRGCGWGGNLVSFIIKINLNGISIFSNKLTFVKDLST